MIQLTQLSNSWQHVLQQNQQGYESTLYDCNFFTNNSGVREHDSKKPTHMIFRKGEIMFHYKNASENIYSCSLFFQIDVIVT